MTTLLAVDAGGTQTRAAVVGPDGAILGYGRSGSGNPTSAGRTSAAASVADAVGQAVSAPAAPAAPTNVAERPRLAIIAMAGERDASYLAALKTRLAAFGVQHMRPQGDLLAMFHSGTPGLDGYALICGTGAIAARVRGGELERIVDGNGWLLGDAGSGFWIGQQVARAVIAAIDGAGPETALTPLVLAKAGVSDLEGSDLRPGGQPDWPQRRITVRKLVSALYATRPVQLSRFAPLAFQASGDAVAESILASSANSLAGLLGTLRAQDIAGPVIGGGGVLLNGFLAAPREVQDQIGLPSELRELVPVEDGLVGAIVLGLRELGTAIDDALFSGLHAGVDRVAKP